MVPGEVGRFHALLIGIDNYKESPLDGCVNDIRTIETFLHDRLQVPGESIRKLLAPRPDGKGTIAPQGAEPTYDNLVQALRQLSGDDVQHGDRVFIYYAGHGATERVPIAESYFEGLVPLDQDEKGLLFDVELNQLLQAIANRSGDLTVILDCCHSAGITRSVPAPQQSYAVRMLQLDENHRVSPTRAVAVRERIQKLGATALTRQLPEEYTVIAACHADETAGECSVAINGEPVKMHGMLTYALFHSLKNYAPGKLAELRWSDIWESIKAVFLKNKAGPAQHPRVLGPKERRIFGGAWRPQDPGYTVRRAKDGSYSIEAGSLAGLGKGAQVAVYGPEPARFPPIYSEADTQARIGMLLVDKVDLTQATAWPIPKDAPFAVPAAARGRLVKPGVPDRLRVAISQSLDPEVRQFLDENQAWSRFVLLPENDPSAEAYVGQYAEGDIWIGDDLFGPGAPLDHRAPGPMGRVRRTEAPDAQDRATGLTAGLDHYAQYVIPLRLCRNGGFTLTEGSVEVRLIDCAGVSDMLELERDAGLRREARRADSSRRYLVKSGTEAAFHVHNNTRDQDLYVSLLLCNLEGRIELLDEDVLLNKGSGKLFWRKNNIGNPLTLVTPADRPWGIDRLIAVATDQREVTFRPLEQSQTMDQIISASIGSRDFGQKIRTPSSISWTAVQTLIQIGGPGT